MNQAASPQYLLIYCWHLLVYYVSQCYLVVFCFIFMKPARTLVHQMLVAFWQISVHRVTPHRSKTIFPEVKKGDTIIAVIYQNI